jgi:hypothetical protein
MSEALRKSAAPVAVSLDRAIVGLSPPLLPAEDNDNQPAPRHAFGETVGFEIPAGIWIAMVSCYAVFLGALLAATGGARAGFAIAISGIYVAMFFGTARTLLRQAPRQPSSPLTRGDGKLATLYGPLAKGEVALQMLIVPALVACFGIAVAVIRAVVA